MRIIDLLRENEMTLSDKGKSAMIRAFKEVYPNLQFISDDDRTVTRFMVYDIPDEDCLKVLQLTARYAGLWVFA